MAKRGGQHLNEEEKRKLNKASLRKLTGVFRYMLPYIAPFIIGLISLALSTLTLLAFPKLAGELLDVASGESKNFTSIYEVSFALMAILFFQGIFGFIRVYTFSIVSERGMADLRKNVYQKFLWLPMTF